MQGHYIFVYLIDKILRKILYMELQNQFPND